MTVTVTDTDIAEGSRMNCRFCPVARAVQRGLNENSEVFVHTSSVQVFDQATDRYDRLTLPDRVSLWVRNFDAGQPVEPITFTLPVPEAYVIH